VTFEQKLDAVRQVLLHNFDASTKA